MCIRDSLHYIGKQEDLQRYDVTERQCGQNAPIFLWAKFFRHGIRIVLLPVCNSGKNDPMENQESLLSVQRKIEYIRFRHRKGISKAAHICSKKSPPNQRKLPWKADDCKQVVVSAKRSFRRYFAWLTVIRVCMFRNLKNWIFRSPFRPCEITENPWKRSVFKGFNGSPYWTWTSDTLINSQVLYRLS